MQARIWTLLAVLLLTSIVYGQEDEWAMDDWGEEIAPERAFSGFLELSAGARLRADPVISTDKTLADLRAQLQWDKDFNNSRVKLTADIYYDGVLEQTRMQIREFAWQGSLAGLGESGQLFDLKVGKQVLTWGTGDYVFLNDLFPKDFQSFFAGRDDDYLKAPSLSAKVSGFFDWVNVDFVVTPQFTPDNYINGDYFSFFSPFAETNVAPGFDVSPPLRPQNPEYALRIYKSISTVEFALYGYRGFHKSPSSFTEFFAPTFSELAVYGASAISTFASGLFNAEVAFYDSLEDKKGQNPLVPNSQLRWLLGYEQELIKNLTGSLQWYVERTLYYEALQANSLNVEFDPKKNRSVLTQRLMYRALQQTLILNLFNFYSTSDDDGYLKMSADYSPVDEWQLSAGVNLFYGEQPYSFFNQFEDASNAFVRFKYYY
jgi:hypothetical protein